MLLLLYTAWGRGLAAEGTAADEDGGFVDDVEYVTSTPETEFKDFTMKVLYVDPELVTFEGNYYPPEWRPWEIPTPGPWWELRDKDIESP